MPDSFMEKLKKAAMVAISPKAALTDYFTPQTTKEVDTSVPSQTYTPPAKPTYPEEYTLTPEEQRYIQEQLAAQAYEDAQKSVASQNADHGISLAVEMVTPTGMVRRALNTAGQSVGVTAQQEQADAAAQALKRAAQRSPKPEVQTPKGLVVSSGVPSVPFSLTMTPEQAEAVLRATEKTPKKK